MAHIWWGAGGLAVVLLTRSQLHLRPLHQALPAQDAVDRRLRYGEAHVVGGPCGQLPATQLRHLPSSRQNGVYFLGSQLVPWWRAGSNVVLKSLLLLPSQPPVVCALGDSQFTECPAFRGGRMKPPWSAPPPSLRHSSADTAGVLRHWYGRFFETIDFKGQIGDQLL